MGRRLQEGQFICLYHDVGAPGTPAMKEWIDHKNPREMIKPLPGPPGSWSSDGIEKRSEEYKKILLRMVAHCDHQVEYKMGLWLEYLTDKKDPGGNSYTQEDMAEIIGYVFNRELSQADISRIKTNWHAGLSGLITGNSQSITDFKNWPPVI